MIKNDFLDRFLERIEQMDTPTVQRYVQRLIRERSILNTIINTVREGIIVLENDFSMEYINIAAYKLLGLPENAPGEKITQYLRDIDWQDAVRFFEESNDKPSRQEIEVFYPEHRFLVFYLVPHPAENDEDLGQMTLILTDITEMRKKAESTIESETLQALTMLSASVAHEIGNPLNSINIHLQLLNRFIKKLDSEHKEEGLELLNIARSEVDRLDTIIQQFLGSVRAAKPDFKQVKIHELLSEALEFMKLEIENKKINVEGIWSNKLHSVAGDSTQLKQAFYNLMKNSIDAMPDGGELKILCIEEGDFLKTTFTDTGKGISVDELGKIYDPYYTTKNEGTGLGLFIVEKIIREHGGRVGISSDEGRGTVFTIWIPWRIRKAKRIHATTIDSEK